MKIMCSEERGWRGFDQRYAYVKLSDLERCKLIDYSNLPGSSDAAYEIPTDVEVIVFDDVDMYTGDQSDYNTSDECKYLKEATRYLNDNEEVIELCEDANDMDKVLSWTNVFNEYSGSTEWYLLQPQLFGDTYPPEENTVSFVSVEGSVEMSSVLVKKTDLDKVSFCETIENDFGTETRHVYAIDKGVEVLCFRTISEESGDVIREIEHCLPNTDYDLETTTVTADDLDKTRNDYLKKGWVVLSPNLVKKEA